MIDDIIHGTLYFHEEEINDNFRFKKEDGDFGVKNTVAGEKAIGIVQSLIYNDLDNNSFIIMDEPEVHLHPLWQLKFAKIVILLAKYGNINFYINSHSPQFIEAIEVYSQKYEIQDHTIFI